MAKQAVVVTSGDNVATATVDLAAGTEVRLAVAAGEITVVVKDDIPFGHKFALGDIGCHRKVIKYGEAIGRTTRDIQKGEHVHVHNVESERGRGDLGVKKDEH